MNGLDIEQKVRFDLKAKTGSRKLKHNIELSLKHDKNDYK